MLALAGVVAIGCSSSTNIAGAPALATGNASDASVVEGGIIAADVVDSTAEASAIGVDAALDEGSRECAVDAECPSLATNPANCAVVTCTSKGQCAYAAKDADGDSHRAIGCKSNVTGVVVELGDDCDDADPDTHPGAWDGPGDATHSAHCEDGIDQNCSGADGDDALADGTTCACKPGDTSTCSEDSGGIPIAWPLDHPVGRCRFGAKTCAVNAKTNRAEWGSCVGAVAPAQESCNGGVDANNHRRLPLTGCNLPYRQLEDHEEEPQDAR